MDADSRFPNILLPRLGDILFIALFVAVIGLGPRLLNQDGDLGRHLTIGEYILDNGNIPTRDLFSHTLAGAALTPHEWLAQVIFAGANRVGGLDGVVIFSALLIAVTFTLVYRQCYQRSRIALISLGWAILGAATASLHWIARPHLFTILMAILWVRELERIRLGGGSRWWALPILMLLWANLHGGFLVGFVIWGIYLIRFQFSETSKMLALGVISALITLINPVGWRLWETGLGFLRNPYLVGHTAEYLPPDFHQASAWPFLVMIALSILLLGLSRDRKVFVHILLLAAWTVMGLYSARNIPLYAVISAPILAEVSAGLIRRLPFFKAFVQLDERLVEVDRGLRGHVWPALAGLAVVAALARGIILDFSGQGNHFSPQVFPVKAVDWMEAHSIIGAGFNYFPWGGYLLYRTWPEQRVFIDGQTDFYGEQLTRQYEKAISMQPGWREVLHENHVRWVLMPPESLLARALQAEPGWITLFRDDTAILLDMNLDYSPDISQIWESLGENGIQDGREQGFYTK